MSREVQHDGAGTLRVRFPFDRKLVELIKTLPNRRWNAAERYWSVPETDVVLLVELLLPRSFGFDSATRELYRGYGGGFSLEPPAPAPRGRSPQPGLFDDAATAPPANGDYTVSRLNHDVKRAIEAAFPEAVWVVGEVSGFGRNAHKRHVSFQLVEHDESGKVVSSINATLFDQERARIEQALREAGEPFRFEDEVTVRVRGRVDLYVPWGSYRIVIEELDVRYTLGEAARRREEIIRRLTEEGLIGVNSALPLPPFPLRVGLVTSIGSDVYNDVVRTLQESGFAFELVVHGARVQGRATEPSVLNALDALRARAARLDVVLVCRGGGSRTDLAWFDSIELGRATARFPLPVIVGIGHEQDHSVLDAVGRRAKTPTAAAAFLVELVREGLQRLDRAGADVLSRAARRIRDEAWLAAQRGRRLALATRALLDRERVELGHRRGRTARAARALLAVAAERLTRRSRDLPRAGTLAIGRLRGLLDAQRRGLSHGARRELGLAAQRLASAASAIGPRASRSLARESERSESRDRRLTLVHPRRVLERGYAILRRSDGPVVKRPAMAPAGTPLRAELGGGTLGLRSEGAWAGEGDER